MTQPSTKTVAEAWEKFKNGSDLPGNFDADIIEAVRLAFYSGAACFAVVQSVQGTDATELEVFNVLAPIAARSEIECRQGGEA